MKPRTYHVYARNQTDADGERTTVGYVVSDAHDAEEAKKGKRPLVAEFFVSLLHEEEVQLARANAMCDQLNADLVVNRLDKANAGTP